MVYDQYDYIMSNIVPYYARQRVPVLDMYDLTMEIDKKGDLVIHHKKKKTELVRFDKDGILSINPIVFLLDYSKALVGDILDTFVGDSSIEKRRYEHCIIIPRKENSGYANSNITYGRSYCLYGPNYELRKNAHCFVLQNPLGGPMKIDVINRRPIANLIDKFPPRKTKKKGKYRNKW